jgi:hypothetical protein
MPSAVRETGTASRDSPPCCRRGTGPRRRADRGGPSQGRTRPTSRRAPPRFPQSLVRRSEGFGVADADLPFEGKSAAKRIGALKVQQQLIAKLFKEGDKQECRKQTVDAYFRMRLAWERAVEEVLLRKVVIRFRKGVETQRLAEVVVDDKDYAEVDAGMSRCSNYAHDKALEGGVAVPDPDELLADIQALDAWRTRVEKRSKETGEKRKAGPIAAGVTAATPA